MKISTVLMNSITPMDTMSHLQCNKNKYGSDEPETTGHLDKITIISKIMSTERRMYSVHLSTKRHLRQLN